MLSRAAETLVVTNGVFMFSAAVSVALRLHARIRTQLGLGPDDYLIIAALFFSWFLGIVIIAGAAACYIGQPFESLNQEQAEAFLEIGFIYQFPYIIAVALVKLSALCFYGRVFQLGEWPRVVRVLIVVVTAWLISFFFATLFQIWPIECNWIFCPMTTNFPAMYVACSASNVLLDLMIITTPLFLLRQIHLNGAQQIGVAGVFGLGIFCVIASIWRLVYTVIYEQIGVIDFSNNFDQAAVNIISWAGIEANASTLCANLPVSYTLFRRLRRGGRRGHKARTHRNLSFSWFRRTEKKTGAILSTRLDDESLAMGERGEHGRDMMNGPFGAALKTEPCRTSFTSREMIEGNGVIEGKPWW